MNGRQEVGKRGGGEMAGTDRLTDVGALGMHGLQLHVAARPVRMLTWHMDRPDPTTWFSACTEPDDSFIGWSAQLELIFVQYYLNCKEQSLSCQLWRQWGTVWGKVLTASCIVSYYGVLSIFVKMNSPFAVDSVLKAKND